MSLYLYSLGQTDLLAGHAWPPGHTNAPVGVVEHGALAAIVSEIIALPTPVRRIDLQRHDAVNRAVLATGLCIPMRWGTIVADQSACVTLLAEQHQRWKSIARRLHGRVELSATIVLATLPEAQIIAPMPIEHQPGTTYLRIRQAEIAAQTTREARVRELETAVRHTLDDLADAVVVTRRGSLVMVAALLLSERFAVAAERLSLTLACSTERWSIGEPWPPYSFVDEAHNG